MERLRSILVVEDEGAARENLQFMLEEFGFDTAGAADAGEARNLLSDPANGFDLILLDVGLPDGDGRELCRWLRREGFAMPVVMLTGHGEHRDVLSGLDSGASDYVPKPYKTGELVARIRAHIRAYAASDNAPFQAGFWEVRPTHRLMLDRRDGRVVRISDRELRMLRLMSKGFPSATSRRGPPGNRVGIQRIHAHAHRGDPCVQAPAEDRTRSLPSLGPHHGRSRLPPGPARKRDGAGVGRIGTAAGSFLSGAGTERHPMSSSPRERGPHVHALGGEDGTHESGRPGIARNHGGPEGGRGRRRRRGRPGQDPLVRRGHLASLHGRMAPLMEQVSIHSAVLRAMDEAWSAAKVSEMGDVPDWPLLPDARLTGRLLRRRRNLEPGLLGMDFRERRADAPQVYFGIALGRDDPEGVLAAEAGMRGLAPHVPPRRGRAPGVRRPRGRGGLRRRGAAVPAPVARPRAGMPGASRPGGRLPLPARCAGGGLGASLALGGRGVGEMEPGLRRVPPGTSSRRDARTGSRESGPPSPRRAFRDMTPPLPAWDGAGFQHRSL